MISGMTLTELRRTYPGLFYAGQDWFRDEKFMRVIPTEVVSRPDRIEKPGEVPATDRGLKFAVELAHAYVNDPNDPIWRKNLWCRDTDQYGQRVFVADRGKGLEIHRHLHIDETFGVPAW